jgi:hypothetical protein
MFKAKGGTKPPTGRASSRFRKGTGRRPIPKTPNEWLAEIAAAYLEAYETLPFLPLVDVEPTEEVLFHLAPRVAINFRGLPLSRSDAAVDAALTSHFATNEQTPGIFDNPHLSFAFSYLASHFGLGLLKQEEVDKVMTFIENRQAELGRAIAKIIGSSGRRKPFE